jgi:hypothetical protein
VCEEAPYPDAKGTFYQKKYYIQQKGKLKNNMSDLKYYPRHSAMWIYLERYPHRNPKKG